MNIEILLLIKPNMCFQSIREEEIDLLIRKRGLLLSIGSLHLTLDQAIMRLNLHLISIK